MFFTMKSARLPCWTTLSRLLFSIWHQFVQFTSCFLVEGSARKYVVHFSDQFRRQRRKIVDEIERVLDLVGNTRGNLAKRCKLLGLHQAILRPAQVNQRRFGSMPRQLEFLLPTLRIGNIGIDSNQSLIVS